LLAARPNATTPHSAILTGPDYRDATFDYNIYWSPDADARSAFTFANKSSFTQWQAAGEDTNSKVADPKFKNAGANDFGFAVDSPAHSMGIVAIDQLAAGVHGGPFAELRRKKTYSEDVLRCR
jgi:hypothetical protein